MGQHARKIVSVLATAAIVWVGSLGGWTSCAQAADAQEVIDQLLREGWQVGPDGMATARQGTAAARQLQDADALYAAGLALLRHHQYDDAAEVFHVV